MAKKRGRKSTPKNFELKSLNLIILLFALAFVMQTCSTGKPTNDDLPPFPQAPPGASIVGNFLTGFQVAPIANVQDLLNVQQTGSNVDFIFNPPAGKIFAVYSAVYIDGNSLSQFNLNSNDERNMPPWLVSDSNSQLIGGFSLEGLNLKVGNPIVQILAYEYDQVNKKWITGVYWVFQGSFEIKEGDFFAGLSAPVTEETPETVAPEEKVDIVIDEAVSKEFIAQKLTSYPSSGSDSPLIITTEGFSKIVINELAGYSNGAVQGFELAKGQVTYLENKGYKTGIIEIGDHYILTITETTTIGTNPGFVHFIDAKTKQVLGALPEGQANYYQREN